MFLKVMFISAQLPKSERKKNSDDPPKMSSLDSHPLINREPPFNLVPPATPVELPLTAV